MNRFTLLIAMLLLECSFLYSQVAINATGNPPEGSSMLDVNSTSKGMLVPRMTMSELEAILNPATGLLVYCINDNNFFVNRGSPATPDWTMVNSKWRTNGPHIFFTGQNVGIGTFNPVAKLDIRGNHPDDPTALMIGDSNLIHKLALSGGRMSDPDPFIQWKETDDLRFMTDAGGGTEIMRIKNDGRVGIGCVSPNSLFQVYFSAHSWACLGYVDGRGSYFFHYEDPANGPGQSCLYVQRQRGFSAPNHGTGYTESTCNTAMIGVSIWGDEYSFGTAGFNDDEFTRCGGILGAEYEGSYWGSLAYKDSGGNAYGGYFTSYASGSGKSSRKVYAGIGISAWGDLMAADFHGKVYGIYSEGDKYAMFSHGAVYKDNLDVHLQENNDGTNSVLYSNVCADVTVMTSGTALLSAGTANIAFDPVFTATVSPQAPVVVTVTPLGESKGVFLANVTTSGMTVVENNNGRSNVTINYIAVGIRAGYENPSLPPEVIDSAYPGKLARGLHNDADTKTDGEGIYYVNGELVVGFHPHTAALSP